MKGKIMDRFETMVDHVGEKYVGTIRRIDQETNRVLEWGTWCSSSQSAVEAFLTMILKSAGVQGDLVTCNGCAGRDDSSQCLHPNTDKRSCWHLHRRE